MATRITFLLLVIAFNFSCNRTEIISLSGEFKTWHKITLEIAGPELNEGSNPNPFLDYRLEAAFTSGETTYLVPGYYAADGDAGETGSNTGNRWKVHFSPDKQGNWNYRISFKTGKNIALSQDLTEGDPLAADGLEGEFVVAESDKKGKDFRGKGRAIVGNGHYLRHAGSGEFFIKGGADSPENFLGYKDFDGTWYGGANLQRIGEDAPNTGLHAYEAHVADWNEGDPEWQNGKGKGIIGALNYLSSKGMNSVYFLTLNILGDGEDVWPYTDRNERYRFDCSKLDQWELVFSHMDSLGIMLHIVLQETENENLLDAGYLDVQRKLYLRELVARFSHHLAITWNLGEEHGPVEWMPYYQSFEDTERMADYLRETDPYKSFIVIHTHPNVEKNGPYISQYLGNPSVNGPSIQAGDPASSHASTLRWIRDSEAAGQNWIVCIDEIGQHWKGAMPDSHDPDHDTIRHQVLWGNLMAGGGGVEWYFGYKYPHADLNCEDWRSRDKLWDQTRYALDFFQKYLPFNRMMSMDGLVKEGYCLASPGEIYALYFPEGAERIISLEKGEGNFSIDWYNPRKGGELQKGSISTISAGQSIDPGIPPYDEGDWVCLIRKL